MKIKSLQISNIWSFKYADDINNAPKITLDSYLDNIVDSESYKRKKNELFEDRVKKEEELARIKTTGSGWLGLMKEFMDRAQQCQKIARAKNTNEELAFFAKTVGSDFFLTDRQLFPAYNLGFAELHSRFLSPSPKPEVSGKSESERETGFAPATSSLARKHSTAELLPQVIS